MSARVILGDGTAYEVSLGVFRPLPGQPSGIPTDTARILTSHAGHLYDDWRLAGNHDPDLDCTLAQLVAESYSGTWECDEPPESDDPKVAF